MVAVRDIRRTVRLMPDPPLLTVPEVAEEFQVTAQTIRNWIDQGVLPAVRVGRAFGIRRADVDGLLDRAQESGVCDVHPILSS
jgi:excisionase family DNA binding protein